ncbi:hypothetical protein [Photorhabdus africana]|uniref:hypothetical protein n=1 Tax=Photorhabdus africana TaxID=3097554 RepID=UPI002B4060F3|nr:hypothetical protein [Photorhabdus sp. CRI-LC]
MEQLIASQLPELIKSASSKVFHQLLQIQLAELSSCLGYEEDTEIDDETVNILLNLNGFIEEVGGKLRLFVDLPDGMHHGFKLLILRL